MNCMFFHVAVMNHYKDVYEELVSDILKSGLHEELDHIYVGISGGDRTCLPYTTDKMTIIHENTKLRLYELPTLQHLQVHARTHPDGKTIYIHTKNASKSIMDKTSTEFKTKLGWWSRELHRQYMSHHIIKKYSNCLKLLDTYDCIGVDFRNQPENSSHFAGNFWWVNNEHLIKLPDLKSKMFPISGPFGDHPRHYCERWLLCYNNAENSFTKPNFKSLFWGKQLRSSLNESSKTDSMNYDQRYQHFENCLKLQEDGKLPIRI